MWKSLLAKRWSCTTLLFCDILVKAIYFPFKPTSPKRISTSCWKYWSLNVSWSDLEPQNLKQIINNTSNPKVVPSLIYLWCFETRLFTFSLILLQKKSFNYSTLNPCKLHRLFSILLMKLRNIVLKESVVHLYT